MSLNFLTPGPDGVVLVPVAAASASSDGAELDPLGSLTPILSPQALTRLKQGNHGKAVAVSAERKIIAESQGLLCGCSAAKQQDSPQDDAVRDPLHCRLHPGLAVLLRPDPRAEAHQKPSRRERQEAEDADDGSVDTSPRRHDPSGHRARRLLLLLFLRRRCGGGGRRRSRGGCGGRRHLHGGDGERRLHNGVEGEDDLPAPHRDAGLPRHAPPVRVEGVEGFCNSCSLTLVKTLVTSAVKGPY